MRSEGLVQTRFKSAPMIDVLEICMMMLDETREVEELEQKSKEQIKDEEVTRSQRHTLSLRLGIRA